MLNYITFNSNEDFVQWQRENENTNIITASPIVKDAGLGIIENEKTSDGKLEVNIGLFVLYTTNQV